MNAVPSALEAQVAELIGRRAAPMRPADRRAAIITATVPLVREHGYTVTTKQIAEASGIGEGTIFRVFTDKAELLDAVVRTALDPADAIAALADIELAQPLAARLLAAVEVLQDRMRLVGGLLRAVGHSPAAGTGVTRPTFDETRARRAQDETMNQVIALIEPDAARLRISPGAAARALRLLTLGGSHPAIAAEHALTATEIVDVVLHGVLKAEGPSC